MTAQQWQDQVKTQYCTAMTRSDMTVACMHAVERRYDFALAALHAWPKGMSQK